MNLIGSSIHGMGRLCGMGTLTEGEKRVRPYKGDKAAKGGNVQGLDCLDCDVLDLGFVVDICISAW